MTTRVAHGVDPDAYNRAPSGLATYAVDGTLRCANATLARWLGYAPEALAELSMRELLTPAGIVFFETQLRPLLSLGRSVEGAFLTLRRADGSTLPVLVNAIQTPAVSADVPATIELAMIVVREREQYEATLREAHAKTEAALQAVAAGAYAHKMQAVGQMAAGIAHEFNNLLAVILGNLEFARLDVAEQLPKDNRIADDLRLATQASERAAAIVRQLLAFTGRHIIAREDVDVNAVIDNAAALIGPALGRDVNWQTRLAPDLWHVHASTDELQLMLTNLVLNARDAVKTTGVPGVITVTTANVQEAEVGGSPRDFVRVVVSDTGVGMDEETRQRAIDPFFSTKGVGGGTGLGLSMVHGAVYALGGTVAIASTAGQGTSVTLMLPR